jgi:hypothetical protein
MEQNSVLNQTGLQNFVEVFKTKSFINPKNWTLDINQKRKKKKKGTKRRRVKPRTKVPFKIKNWKTLVST